MRTKTVPRFTAAQRLIHWTVGISFVLLLLTGLAFAFPSLFWLTIVLGGPTSARILHPWVGVVYVVALAAMCFTWAREMYLDDRDKRWLRSVPAYAKHDVEHVPEAGKYNGGQKIYFWISLVLGIVFLVTGLPMWFQATFSAGLLTVMRLLHFLATLAGGLLLMVHVYLSTIAFPGTAHGMITGRVDRRWAWLHHRAWLREQEKG